MTDEAENAEAVETAETADIESTETPEVAEATQEVEVSSEDAEPTKSEAESGDEPTEKERKKNSFQERINQKTRQAKEAEQRARQAEEATEDYKRQLEEIQANAPKMPTLEEFDYDQTQYTQAMAEYNAAANRSAVQDALTDQQRFQADQAKKEAQQAMVQAFTERTGAFRDEHADFDTVVQDPNFKQGAAMTQAILIADNGPAIAYHLAKNPGLTNDINQMNPVAAAMELGRISGRLATEAPVKTTKTPTPVTPISTASKGSEKSPDEMSADEYRKFRGYSK